MQANWFQQISFEWNKQVTAILTSQDLNATTTTTTTTTTITTTTTTITTNSSVSCRSSSSSNNNSRGSSRSVVCRYKQCAGADYDQITLSLTYLSDAYTPVLWRPQRTATPSARGPVVRWGARATARTFRCRGPANRGGDQTTSTQSHGRM